MANTDIIPPRVDFLDARTGKISREWYMFLLEVFRRVGGTTSDDSIPDVVVDGYLEAIQPIHGLNPSPFVGVEPQIVQLIERIMLEVAPPQSLGGFPYAQWSPNLLEASIAQLRQEFTDFRSLIETAPTAMDGVDDAELDCDTLEAIGYWSPVTDGASNIIYTGGEVVVAFTCTS